MYRTTASYANLDDGQLVEVTEKIGNIIAEVMAATQKFKFQSVSQTTHQKPTSK